MKVVRFHEEKTYEAPQQIVEAPETGWLLKKRHLLFSIASATIGVLLAGAVLFTLIAALSNGLSWSLEVALWLLLATAATAAATYWLGGSLLVNGMVWCLESLRDAAKSKVAVSKDSFRAKAGVLGAEAAAQVNRLIGAARNETAPAPLAAYREAFLAGAQPGYLCDFSTGRFLDCNHAFADFVGMEREVVLAQRLGDITVAASSTASKETGAIPTIALENAPAVEMRFRHSRGQALDSVVFLRAIDDPARPGRMIHCAVVIPQDAIETEAA